MAAAPAAPVLAVAFSGGRDSTALLHAVWRQARGTGLRVVALHVHHGLMPQADRWLAQARAQVHRWAAGDAALQFRARRLTTQPVAGESVEAWARRERYAALAELARTEGADTVLLAHHRRDQAETVLLQALRGAGPRGLAAMPRLIWRDGLCWIRPWLDQPATAIAHYVARHRLRHVEDDSNQDLRFARNRIRQAVLPVLTQHFPAASEALVAVARHSQAAAQLIDEVARADLHQLGSQPDRLPLQGWAQLSPVRQQFALQTWLRQAAGYFRRPPPHEALQAQMLARLGRPGAARWSSEGGLVWQLYRGVLSVTQTGTVASSVAPGAPASGWPVRGVAPVRVPAWPGTLRFEPAEAGGLSLFLLEEAWLLPRQGGETFQRGPGRPPRSLKKQFQAAGVPAWLRDAPLLCRRDPDTGRPVVLFVPGLGVDARHQAAPGTPQWRPVWTADRRETTNDPIE